MLTGWNFYPRSPCGERQHIFEITPGHVPFLSTFPLRGTSCLQERPCRRACHFYPRSPCGERLHIGESVHASGNISIHVPLAGNVYNYPVSCFDFFYFYPRSPCGERPDTFLLVLSGQAFLSTFPLRGTSTMGESIEWQTPISIHVPLAGNVWPEILTMTWGLAFLSTFPLRGTSRSSAS